MSAKKTFYKTPDGSIMEWGDLEPGKDWVKLGKEGAELYRQDCIKSLKKILGRNPKIYTTVNNVARSGMSREISSFAAVKGEIVNLNWYVTRILGWKQGQHGVRVIGCGMDMGFHLVYSLSSSCYKDGYKIKQSWL